MHYTINWEIITCQEILRDILEELGDIRRQLEEEENLTLVLHRLLNPPCPPPSPFNSITVDNIFDPFKTIGKYY
jgi:hypothetical protein